jgi:hypothetical protein
MDQYDVTHRRNGGRMSVTIVTHLFHHFHVTSSFPYDPMLDKEGCILFLTVPIVLIYTFHLHMTRLVTEMASSVPKSWFPHSDELDATFLTNQDAQEMNRRKRVKSNVC